MTINLTIAGASGRMGRALIVAAGHEARFHIVGGTERTGSEFIGTDLGLLDGRDAIGCYMSSAVLDACQASDVWIDFTSPSATIAALPNLAQTRVKALIIGTTGFTEAQEAVIAASAQQFVIVRSGNFSLGINLIAGLIRQAAARLGPDWDIEVLESHHRHKVDAPSGTALMLGHAAASGRGVDHDDVARFARHGQIGARTRGDIGYSVIRAGGIIGDHKVMFAAEDEIITLGHQASNRTIFAKGALAAAAWAMNQTPNLYNMDNVLGL